jgi:hypothetical protein
LTALSSRFEQHLTQRVGVSQRLNSMRCYHLERGAGRFSQRCKLTGCFSHERRRQQRPPGAGPLVLVQSRESQHVVDEPHEPAGFLHDRTGRERAIGVGACATKLQRLTKHKICASGVAHLVRDGGCERGALTCERLLPAKPEQHDYRQADGQESRARRSDSTN